MWYNAVLYRANARYEHWYLILCVKNTRSDS